MKDFIDSDCDAVVGFNLLQETYSEKPYGHVHAGPGGCKSCDCTGFRSTPKKDDVCGYCGHYWAMHR